MIDRLLVFWLFFSVIAGVGLFFALFLGAGRLPAFFSSQHPITKADLVTGPVTRLIWMLAYGLLMSYFPALAVFVYRLFRQ